jgi:hypothetical protein
MKSRIPSDQAAGYSSTTADVAASSQTIAKPNVGGSFFKPLCVGELNQLKENIYKEQFFDYDETISAGKVLDELQNLKNNPKLLDYVIKCLANQQISTTPNVFYAVVLNAEKRMEYNETIHKSFEQYKKLCIDGDFGLKKQDHLLTKVYNSFGDIENEMMKIESETIVGFGETKFETYTIHEIGRGL